MSEIGMIELEKILAAGYKRRASDIHITPGSLPVFRFDGELRTVKGMDSCSQHVIEALMALSGKQESSTGDMDFGITLRKKRQRVNLYRSNNQLCAAIRLLSEGVPRLCNLGLPAVIRQFIQMPDGLVLVTGPTGSGKSTTLAGMIEEINRCRSVHIITLEDPVEYIYKSKKSLIHQREVGRDVISFEDGLRSALREDPDVILVGEMRDAETMAAAIKAAETGHLVFSTLHTAGAVQSVERIVNAFSRGDQSYARSQLSLVLRGVVSQQLVKQAAGGRTPVCEIMVVNKAISNLIAQDKTAQIKTIIQMSGEQGMITFEDAFQKKCAAGEIAEVTAKDDISE